MIYYFLRKPEWKTFNPWLVYMCGHSACILSWFCTLKSTDFLIHEIFSNGWSPFGILLNNSKWLHLTPSWNNEYRNWIWGPKKGILHTSECSELKNICVILVRYFNFFLHLKKDIFCLIQNSIFCGNMWISLTYANGMLVCAQFSNWF